MDRNDEPNDEARIQLRMAVLGVSRSVAEEIDAIENGESDGDVVIVDETGAVVYSDDLTGSSPTREG